MYIFTDDRVLDEVRIVQNIEQVINNYGGEILQKEIFNANPHLLPRTIIEFIEKHSRSVVNITIGDMLCFKNKDLINSDLPDDFRGKLNSIIEKLRELDISINEVSLNVALSLNYNCNFKKYFNLENSNLFQNIIHKNTNIENINLVNLAAIPKENKLTINMAIYTILKEAGRPLRVKEIARQILETGIWKSKNRSSINKYVAVAMTMNKKNIDEHSPIVQISRGVYALREWGETTTFANIPKGTKQINKMTIIKILEEVGKPLPIGEITTKIFEAGTWKGKPSIHKIEKTIAMDIANFGIESSFILVNTGVYALRKWNKETDIPPKNRQRITIIKHEEVDDFVEL